jgi:CRP/FNR family cyclic AMP-dependent transcriptional regulator
MSIDPTKLQQYACFRDLTAEQCAAVAHIAMEERFDTGHTLFEEGQEGTHIFLISEGEVEILYNIGEGGPSRVDQLQSGEIIGCSLLIDPFTYTSTTRSLTEIKTMVIDAHTLRKLMIEDCLLGFSIQKHLIRMLLDRIIDLRLGV